MINCGDYDYIEIACMHGYDVQLTFKDGKTLEGKALDTTYNQNKQECMTLLVSQEKQNVVLDDLLKMKVLTAKADFDLVVFK